MRQLGPRERKERKRAGNLFRKWLRLIGQSTPRAFVFFPVIWHKAACKRAPSAAPRASRNHTPCRGARSRCARSGRTHRRRPTAQVRGRPFGAASWQSAARAHPACCAAAAPHLPNAGHHTPVGSGADAGATDGAPLFSQPAVVAPAPVLCRCVPINGLVGALAALTLLAGAVDLATGASFFFCVFLFFLGGGRGRRGEQGRDAPQPGKWHHGARLRPQRRRRGEQGRDAPQPGK